MNIFYHEKAQEFHLQNESVSYIMKVLKKLLYAIPVAGMIFASCSVP
mgnify:CR=1 FL=1